jgi:hypothetical protein
LGQDDFLSLSNLKGELKRVGSHRAKTKSPKKKNLGKLSRVLHFTGSHRKTENSRKLLPVFVFDEADFFGKFCFIKKLPEIFGDCFLV